MQQLIDFWMGLDGRRRLVLILAAGAVFAAVMGLSRLVNAPSYTLLYSGLEPGAAGEVVQALEQRGAVYDVRGDSIYVDAGQRDQLRMTLASEGLPMISGQGYELLDSLSGFGTTAQMFDAAYWRAKEGELARTIQSSAHIRSARVHIGISNSQPFRSSQPGSASVTAISSTGALSSANAEAMRYLVASAVAGLDPGDVAVIDGRSGVVVPRDVPGAENGGSSDRAETMKRNVERLLEARVGHGNAIVELSVDTVTEREAITERRFDPDGRVAISSETEERSNSANDAGNGGVTVASNLPQGDTSAGQQNSSSQDSTTREVVNYEVSETKREILRTPGAIKRISVAVLVNGVTTTDPATGEETFQPRGQDELQAMHDLVASAIGFDPERGDTITLKSMQLSLPDPDGEPAASSLIQTLNLDVMRLIQVGVLAVVALVLGLFVLRPLFSRPPAPRPLPALAAPRRGADSAPPLNTDDADADERASQGGLAPLPAMQMAHVSLPALNGEIDDGPGGFGDPAGPADRLRRLIDERQDESVEILRGWIEEDRERA